MSDLPFRLRSEDRADGDDDDGVAIAIEVEKLGQIEADVLMMNGYIGEARQAVREALARIDSPTVRRLLHRAQRANNDAIGKGLGIVERTRTL